MDLVTTAAGTLLAMCAATLGCAHGEAFGEPTQDADVGRQRERMVESQIRRRGVVDDRVLAAMRRVPRHEFVPDAQKPNAYDDTPLPIGHGQTISQPYIVAYMTEALELAPGHRVLEIGTGSGYQAAVLAELVREVYTIEIVDALAASARATFLRLGYRNIHARAGDGYAGWPDVAPFDRIILTAAPPALPQALVDQLAVGGILIAPVGPTDGRQVLTVVRRTDAGVTREDTLDVRFVPMVRE